MTRQGDIKHVTNPRNNFCLDSLIQSFQQTNDKMAKIIMKGMIPKILKNAHNKAIDKILGKALVNIGR